MIRHIVIWTLNGEDAAARTQQAAEIRAALEPLAESVPSVRTLAVIENAVALDNNAHIAIDATFDDEAGLREYIEHPEHQAILPIVRARVSARSAIDAEV